jgi:all-trans-retinol 13,14-reductase
MHVRSLQQTSLARRYDAVIIGSGLGGLTAARLLAEAGRSVLVLERHYTLGGFTHVFKRKGWEWDVGVHYVGQLDHPRRTLRRLFDRVTDGKLEWASMGDVVDRIVFPDAEYPFYAGVAALKDGLKSQFPTAADGRAIDGYVERVFEAVGASRFYYLEKAVDGIAGGIGGRVLPQSAADALGGLARAAVGPWMRRRYLALARRTTYEVLRELTAKPRLIAVLSGQYGDYGLPPKRSSFVMHAAVAQHYFGGGYYPVGGSASIAAPIVAGIEARGGLCMVRAAVEQILVRGGQAVGVRLAGGQEVEAGLVVSNAGVHATHRLLAADAERLAAVAALPASVAHASLYLGFEGDPQALQLPRANDWIYPGDDHDAQVERFERDATAPLPVAYVSYPAAKDPDFPRRFPGKSTVEVITLAPWERFSAWADSTWQRRPADYEAAKAELSERLLAALWARRPQLRAALRHCELSTPLSTQHFTGVGRGEIYGLTHAPERFAAKGLRPATELPGLYLTGQDVITCGVAGALFSGFLTASVILRRNLLSG